MGGRAAGPAPSFPPARPNRNLLQCCGERRGRGARGRAGCGPGWPRLAEGRREGARQGSSPARSLARSLPPSAGGFSQSASSSQRVREPQRARAWDAGVSSCHCSSGCSSGGRRSPAPEPPVRRGSGGGAGAGARGVELSPWGRSWRPRRRCSLFVCSTPQAPGRGAGSPAEGPRAHTGTLAGTRPEERGAGRSR